MTFSSSITVNLRRIFPKDRTSTLLTCFILRNFTTTQKVLNCIQRWLFQILICKTKVKFCKREDIQSKTLICFNSALIHKKLKNSNSQIKLISISKCRHFLEFIFKKTRNSFQNNVYNLFDYCVLPIMVLLAYLVNNIIRV